MVAHSKTTHITGRKEYFISFYKIQSVKILWTHLSNYILWNKWRFLNVCSNCINSTQKKRILVLFVPFSSLILQRKTNHSVEEPNLHNSCTSGINDCVWFCPGKARRCVPTRLKYPWRTAKPLAKTNLSKTKPKGRGEYPFLTREECCQRLTGEAVD